MDNGTMVEAFKFLNYYQLATSSLVTKRFRDLIRTHRHKLALLHIYIFMEQPNLTADGGGHTDTDEGILMAVREAPLMHANRFLAK
ncbi:hypothetical protein DdX_19983 [Ditylenchus destructor]|uniref:F-box domain-containing protein n=1 Tax=Ditylenchus destructor TaxID=166010 RepID=A0AAD4MGY1_9BILA|nr:hypothetical protein DdX_19983 [Ditylenchus destructor]